MIPAALYHLFDNYCRVEGLHYNLVRLDETGFEIDMVGKTDRVDAIAESVGFEISGHGRYTMPSGG
jgi:hypothetical protein